jgi:hypothetical protein
MRERDKKKEDDPGSIAENEKLEDRAGRERVRQREWPRIM